MKWRNGLPLSRLYVWALALSLAICFSPDLSAQTPPPSMRLNPQEQQQMKDLYGLLLTINLLSLQLGPEIATWPQQIKALQDSSQLLQQQLIDSQKSLSDSEKARAEQQVSLDKSQKAQDEQLKSYEASRKASESIQANLQAQVAQERADKLKWEIGAGIGTAIIIGVAGYAGGHALHLW
jgi:hypothetical protein